VLNWLYGAFVLPESLPPGRRRAFSWRRANPVGALVLLRRLPGILELGGMYFLYMLGSLMLQSVWVLYTGYRYGWNTLQVGLSLTFVGISMAVVQGRLVHAIIGWLGEQRGLAIGLVLTALVMIGYGSATEGWMIYVLIAFAALGGIAGPAAQAIITRRVPADEQGAVQGALASLGSLAGVAGPPLAAWSFGLCIAPQAPIHLPGVAFFEAAGLVLLALVLALRALQAEAVRAGAAV